MKPQSTKIIVSFFCIMICFCIIFSTASTPNETRRSSSSSSVIVQKTVNKLDANVGGTVIPSTSQIPESLLKLQKKYNIVAIPTYDGSYQLTHPKVLYFSKGWNGYQYWMSMTPYPFEHDIYENPSIVVSNDGKTWVPPTGLTNPVSGIPADSKTGGHYSDPQLVMRGDTMELWYRYNPAMIVKEVKQPLGGNALCINTPKPSANSSSANNNKPKQSVPKKIWRRANNSINIYFRRTSKDGIHWTGAQKLLESKDGHLSLCVNFEDGVYKTWYATYGGDLLYSESKDALDWSAPIRCTVPLPKGFESYHQDMIKYGSEYYLLQTAEQVSNYTFQLFLLRSEDGIRFSQVEQVFPNKDLTLWKNISFYRSTLFVKDGKLELYVSMIIPHLKWYMTQVTLPLPKPDANTNKSTTLAEI